MLLRRCPDRRNRTGEIVEALRTAPDGSVIRFEPGIYDFSADDAFSGYFCPSCNKSSDKKVIFPVLRKKNITLDGGGAEFVFHDRVFPFIVQDSVGVTLENFSVDFSFPRCVICDVQTVGEDGICLSIDRAKYDYRTNEEGNLLIRAGNDEFSTCERRFFLKQGTRGNTDCCYLSAGEIFYDNDNLPAEVFYCYAEETDGGVFLRRDGRSGFSPRFTAGAELLLSYDEQRDNDVFFFDRSENITVRNVSIHNGAGMGFVGQCCRDLTLRTVDIPALGGLFHDRGRNTADEFLGAGQDRELRCQKHDGRRGQRPWVLYDRRANNRSAKGDPADASQVTELHEPLLPRRQTRCHGREEHERKGRDNPEKRPV